MENNFTNLDMNEISRLNFVIYVGHLGRYRLCLNI
jgi:hypothetical protein